MEESKPRYVHRSEHAVTIHRAIVAAECALMSAERLGRRTDCLRQAVDALRGALRNVAMEDADALAQTLAPKETPT